MSEITRRGFVKGAALAPLALTPLRSMAQQAAPGDRFDFVFAGAGHNSLICAAYLAKGGYKVLVLEGRPRLAAARRRRKFACRDSKRICAPACTRESPTIR